MEWNEIKKNEAKKYYENHFFVFAFCFFYYFSYLYFIQSDEIK